MNRVTAGAPLALLFSASIATLRVHAIPVELTCDFPPDAPPSYLNDGYCDIALNSASCDWDGGDCCESTCESTLYTCGVIGYHCQNGNATDFLNGICSAPSSLVGDGFCDAFFFTSSAHINTNACEWDGGDCCPSTCSGACDHIVFQCSDPNATDFGAASDCTVAHPSWLGDAYCDASESEGAAASPYNSQACAWDGGDCCESTCLEEEAAYACGTAPYACADPDASESSGRGNLDGCNATFLTWLGDAYCDDTLLYNVAACNWDGGDCCESSCISNDYYSCGTPGYSCQDPDAQDSNSTTQCSRASLGGDGVCDDVANNNACSWDQGDCCPSTCAADCINDSYECKDPDASDFGSVAGCRVAILSWVGDAYCDISGGYNTETCGWDGGDCCPETCLLEENSYNCTMLAFHCQDPDSSNYFNLSACSAEQTSWLGDGYCDHEDPPTYNSANCGWDGGDCCETTCISSAYPCATNDYDCLDPDETPLTRAPRAPAPSRSTTSALRRTTEVVPTRPPRAPAPSRNDRTTAAVPVSRSESMVSTPYQGATLPIESTSTRQDSTTGTRTLPITDSTTDQGTTLPTERSTTRRDSTTGTRTLPITDSTTSNGVPVTSMQPAPAPSHNNPTPCMLTPAAHVPGGCSDENFTQPSPIDNPAPGAPAPAPITCSALSSKLGDTVCDALENGYNIAACGWDGGDCCVSTCDNTADSSQCGVIGFACRDPSANDFGFCPASNSIRYGDGFCDMFNSDLTLHLNSKNCNWDDGDCCPSTCRLPNGDRCANTVYDCLDPSTHDVGSVSECRLELPSSIGDGFCDNDNEHNTEICGWDGGDCCPDTCTPQVVTGSLCNQPYSCRDPSSSNYRPELENCAAEPLVKIGDGLCDDSADSFNSHACAWDGGDCCARTCDDFGVSYSCGTNGYNCLDPDGQSTEPTTTVSSSAPCAPLCNGNPSTMGNGKCNNVNNKCACNWDNGDCCGQAQDSNQYASCETGPDGSCCLDPSFVWTSTTFVSVSTRTSSRPDSTTPRQPPTLPVTDTTTTQGRLTRTDRRSTPRETRQEDSTVQERTRPRTSSGGRTRPITTTEGRTRPISTTTGDRTHPISTTPEDRTRPFSTTTEGRTRPISTTTEDRTRPISTTTEDHTRPFSTTSPSRMPTDSRTTPQLSTSAMATTSSSTSTPADSRSNPSNAGIFSDLEDLDSPGTLIVIIVVACVVFVIIVVIVAVAVVRSKQKHTRSAAESPRRGHRVGAVHVAPGSRSATYLTGVVDSTDDDRVVRI